MNKQDAYEIASGALKAKSSIPVSELLALVGSSKQTTVSGPDGQTYFLELSVERLPRDGGVRLTAAVDLGNSFKLERIEESVEILND